jgi:hypothetical protein
MRCGGKLIEAHVGTSIVKSAKLFICKGKFEKFARGRGHGRGHNGGGNTGSHDDSTGRDTCYNCGKSDHWA